MANAFESAEEVSQQEALARRLLVDVILSSEIHTDGPERYVDAANPFDRA